MKKKKLKIRKPKIETLVATAKESILRHLKEKPLSGKELGKSVIHSTGGKDGPTPIHTLAFILAYKELEQNGEIRIARPRDIPFPATDYETTFELVKH